MQTANSEKVIFKVPVLQSKLTNLQPTEKSFQRWRVAMILYYV